MGKTLVVKLGSEQNGWLPSEKHYNDIKYKLIQSGVLKKFDGYIITHFGTNFEIIDTDKLKIESPENYFEIKTKEDIQRIFGDDGVVLDSNKPESKGENIKSLIDNFGKDLDKYGFFKIDVSKLAGTSFTITENSIKVATEYFKRCKNATNISQESIVRSILYLAFAFGDNRKDPNGLEKI